MAIPKIIYQTYSTTKIPLYAQLYIWNFKRRHRDYQYIFYDDKMIEAFVKENFSEKVFHQYSRLQIGAAKADFFRYAILYIHGGIYLDIDSSITISSLNKIWNTSYTAIIAREKTNKHLYAQWALIYEKKHPILKNTLNIIITNIMNNMYPNDVVQTTGPIPYSQAVHQYLKDYPEDKKIKTTEDNYKGIFQFKTILARIHELLYTQKHWRHLQKEKTVYKIANNE